MKVAYEQGGVTLYHGDALEVLRGLPDASIDAIVSDPPYPEIARPYGRLSESEWRTLMDGIVSEALRLLRPTGSAVFVLQANQEGVGRTRSWLWEFVAHWSRKWNLVQDAYWWNFTSPPTIHCQEARGLLRPSVKMCVWLGPPYCYRNQSAVLWSPSEAQRAVDLEDRALRRHPSGQSMRPGRFAETVERRGGVTPFNCLPMANTDSASSAGAHGHGAGTPLDLARWWVRYLTPPAGTVLDPFMGSGTTAIAAHIEGMRCIGVEAMADYVAVAAERCAEATRQSLLPLGASA